MKFRNILLTAMLVSTLAASTSAVTRTARSLYSFDVYTGWSGAFGNYTGIGPIDWTGGDVSASDLFDPTYHFGFELGRLMNDRTFFGIGYRYTKINLDDNINSVLSGFDIPGLKFHQHDINFDFNFYPVSPVEESMAPFFGPGVIAGFTSVTAPGYRSESQFTIALAINFGLDLQVWKAVDKRSFVTLSSVNSWQVVASGDRPRYLNLGGAVRYFFRP